jgi:endonuclease YncB( thermonuclease family)
VATGYALSFSTPHHPHQQTFDAAQEKAKQAQKGLWGSPCNGDITKPDPRTL